MSGATIVYPTAQMLRASLADLPAGWLGELGERLRDDASGELHKHYVNGFDAAADKARGRLARPLPEADFAATQATIMNRMPAVPYQSASLLAIALVLL